MQRLTKKIIGFAHFQAMLNDKDLSQLYIELMSNKFVLFFDSNYKQSYLR